MVDQYVQQMGYHIEFKTRSVTNLPDWVSRSLTPKSSTELRNLIDSFPDVKIKVYDYSPKEVQLGGDIIIFVGMESSSILGVYRGK